VEDLDEQNFQDVNVNQIQYPNYSRILMADNAGHASADDAAEVEPFLDEEFQLYDDELANESANVSEKNNAESANGASIHQAVSSSISQNKVVVSTHNQTKARNSNPAAHSSSINRISSSGFH